MADDTSQFDSQFEGEVKGLSIGTGNVIYNYFYSHPSQATTEEVAETDNLPCPYRGLFHFGPNDAQFFFGRESFIQELYGATKTERLIPVLGASGSGKSSVVLAGLVPKLVQDGHWQLTHFRPGSEPFHSLALSLVPLYTSDETDQIIHARKLSKSLQNGELPLADVFLKIRQNHLTDQILLIIDQFEELYTLCSKVEIRHQFLDALIADLPGTVVMTMRADFLGNALSYRPFADVLNRKDYKLGSMNREELTDVIVKPAEAQGVGFEAGLIERILDDVNHQPGNLPLLEFALTQLWHQQRGKTLTHEVYAAIGEVEGALARHADETYGRLSEGEKERVRQIFVQLVLPGEGAEDTRRVAVKEQLREQSWSLVKQLADARLVVTSRDGQERETVEVVHEALIRNWGELRGWMETDRTFRAWQERLRGAKRQWEATGKDAGSLLRGAFLAEAQERLEERPQELGAETEFIRLSMAEKEREEKEKETRKRQQIRTLGQLVVVSWAALIVTTGLFFTARYQQKQAELSEADSLARYSLALSNEGKDFDAAIALLKANKILEKHQSSDPELMAAVTTYVYESRERQRFYGHQGPVYSVSYSPDGKTLASGGSDGKIKLWNLETGAKITTLTGHQKLVSSLSYSPDGKTLASGSSDGTIKLWDAGTGKELTTLTGDLGSVRSLSYSLDGKTLASAGLEATVSGHSDAMIKLWDVETGEALTTLTGDRMMSNSYSPDGKTLASGTYDGTIKLWDAGTGKELTTLTYSEEPVSRVSYSPDGKTLVSGSDDGIIKLWDLETGEDLITLIGHQKFLSRVSYNSDGKTLVSGSADGTIKVWDLETGEELITLIGDRESAGSVSYSPDGKTLASGSHNGTVKVWNLETGEDLITLTGDRGLVNRISYSPDGKTLASAGADGTIKLWGLRTGEELNTLAADQYLIGSLSYSPDSKTLASIGVEGKIKNIQDLTTLTSGVEELTIKLWNLETGGEITILTGDQGPGTAGLSYSPDGKTLASSSPDGSIKLWDTETGEEITSLTGHQRWASSLSYSPDGKTLASGSADGSIKLWDTETGEEITSLISHQRWVSSLSYSPDGKTLASGSSEGTIKLWDTETGEEITSLTGHQGMVRSLSYSPDGKTLASGSDDRTIKLWDLEKREELTTLTGYEDLILSVSYSPDGKTLFSGSNDGTIKVWDVDFDSLMQRTCQRVRPYLSNPHAPLSDEERRLCDGIGDGE
ncbi:MULTISPECIES: WD40 repeat domain-containing protein [unclassified Roseofilum]|uniref:WD40 repeat domain-containing protein n=1 Tax=unclassified Roseofilum TaxID=2620099 RepID=UPI00298EC233|nr:MULTISPECIES: WD40 repeat domain-containing protein [unclassified Roseofilum]